MAASGDPEYAAVTTEYTNGGGIWSVRSVMLADQVAALLDQTEDGNISATIEEVLGTISWLDESASESKKMGPVGSDAGGQKDRMRPNRPGRPAPQVQEDCCSCCRPTEATRS